jgi:hypothetical protein
MAATLVYYGLDTCHRMAVLSQAGYSIENSNSLGDLDQTLGSCSQATAVLMTDHDGLLPQDAIALARSRSTALLILFRDSNLACADSSFDLVIPSLTPPEQWLTHIADLIDQSHHHSDSQPLPTKAGTSRQQAAFLQPDDAELYRDSHEYPGNRVSTRLASKDSAFHS